MVKRIYFLIAIVILSSCFFDTKLHDLTMKKTPYFGDELRIDGYYHSNPVLNDERYIGVAVFYKDGFCIHTWGRPVNQDTLSYIENELLLNDVYIAKIKNAPAHIGVFQIIYPDIQFEVWEYRSDPWCHFGKIVNDTTFIINKKKDRTGKTYSVNLTYRFQQFSQKPDSTNNFLK